MKKLTISFLALALSLLAGHRAMAQCSAQGATFAYCSATGGPGPTDGQEVQQYYYITPGTPVIITDELNVYGAGGCSVEADVGPVVLWYDDLMTAGSQSNSADFDGSQDSNGVIYLSANAGGASTAYVSASW